ncbi:hypothetical protein Taro_045374 [Colocasia esculenta]|uniref:Uncharacterized protein n=1 Tax=Colocasia esculenta TaxID=4460 RepID=A0A843X442_COLES|nr:hypothetical protein [Colocasia esculenta]
MRRDYWETLCNIWAAKRWQQTSTTMIVNQFANPKANMHTSGSVSFATHQSRLESYSQQMIEKYVGEEEQPQLNPEVAQYGYEQDTISGLESRLAQTMETRLAHTMETHLVETMETRLQT